MLLAHFDSQFSDAEATAVGTTQDVVRASASFSPLFSPRRGALSRSAAGYMTAQSRVEAEETTLENSQLG